MKAIQAFFANGVGYDGEYRRTTNRLGAALLCFLGLFTLGDAVVLPALERFWEGVLPYRVVDVAVELTDALLYFLSFVIPVILYAILTPRSQRAVLPLAPRLPKRLGLLLPAGLSVIYCAAAVNAFMTRHMGLAPSQSVVWRSEVTLWQGLLMFLVTALIPAFCEELLFRGLIFSELLPYGRTIALVASAVLFGLMHQNPRQFLYTTVAGLVLGWLVLESGSLWAAVLLHMMNNTISVIGEILPRQLPTREAEQLFAIVEVLLIGSGLLCLVCYLLRYSSPSTLGRESCLPDGQQSSIRPVRSFFSPLMSGFVLLAAGQMLLLVAVRWGLRLL